MAEYFNHFVVTGLNGISAESVNDLVESPWSVDKVDRRTERIVLGAEFANEAEAQHYADCIMLCKA